MMSAIDSEHVTPPAPLDDPQNKTRSNTNASLAPDKCGHLIPSEKSQGKNSPMDMNEELCDSDADSHASCITEEDGFTVQRKRRRRKQVSNSSSDTIITIDKPVFAPTSGLTVIFAPTDSGKLLTKLNQLKLSQLLESHAPDGIIQIRPNLRLNLLAVDTRNRESTTSLLRVTILLGIAVRAYEPRSPLTAVGVIKGVDATIDLEDLHSQLRSNVPVTSVRRLGTSSSVCITFASRELPDHVLVGFVRHKTELFLDSPVQCRQCGKFGHVQSTCNQKPTCSRCSGAHIREACTVESPRCSNCGKDHEAFSHECVKWQAEREIYRFRRANAVGYAAALKATKPCPEQTKKAATHQQSASAAPQACAHTSKIPASPVVSAVNHATKLQDRPLLREVVCQERIIKRPKGRVLHDSQQADYRKAAEPKVPQTPAENTSQPSNTPRLMGSTPSRGTNAWSAIILAVLQSIQMLLSQSTSSIACVTHQLIDLIMPMVMGYFS